MRVLLLVLLLAGCDSLGIDASAECECGEQATVRCEVNGIEKKPKGPIP